MSKTDVGEGTFLKVRIGTALTVVGLLVGGTVTGTVAVLKFMHDTTDAIKDLSGKLDAASSQSVSRPALTAWIEDVNKALRDQAVAIQTGMRVDAVVLPDISRYPNNRHSDNRDHSKEVSPPVLGEPSRRRLIVQRDQASY